MAAVATGIIDADGTPRIHFELTGDRPRGGKSAALLEGVIDTGFVGFLSIPIEQAFVRRLELMGYTYAKLADGRTCQRLTANGYARIGDRCEEVTVILEPNSDEALVGVALLRALGLALVLTRNEVVLLDEHSIGSVLGMGRNRVRDSSGVPSWGASYENFHDLSQSEVHEESGDIGVASGARS